MNAVLQEIADNFNIVEEEKIEEKKEEPKQNLTEVIRLINDVRESIPDIPEIKCYDNELKELSEHLMLLDLGRNDTGKVSKINTVKVTESFIIERYSHVMHIVSNVVGEYNKKFSKFFRDKNNN